MGVGRGGLTRVQAVRGWLAKDVAVVPEEAVYPPNQSPTLCPFMSAIDLMPVSLRAM